ncbi:hypothetical protein Q4575_13205 [Psychrosphaera sp. 1_MG-2023]|uniref:hypothetical protein n=1 Tax=Psychrosphaera sp. 1_MG-2023 TaxID=3062643 RepID=UPI0026E3DE49|nr:hypothetical protein [Psychrosphaera sp. 1_MG-2023]MDO6720369.1 hypothetical protein [Psychrosphaera sp. 1_MG-2023]
MKIILSIVFLTVIASGYFWYSAMPTAVCKSSETSTPYCKYIGKINKIYLNRDGLALVFIDAPFGIKQAKEYGYDIKSGNIVALNINDSLADKYLYDMLNSAFTNQNRIEMHARNTLNGYLKLDRIWINK